MAHIEKQKNGRWKARYRTPEGRQRGRTFDRKVDAERFATTAEATKLDGSYVDPSAGRRSVGDYVVEWQAAQVWRPTTRLQVESHLRNHVLPAFGGRPLVSVRPTEVQAFVRALSDRLAPSTVEVIYRYLVAIFQAAVRDRLIAHTPCVGVKLPKQERRPVEPLEADEVEALVNAVGERYRAVVLLAASTGLRQGEVFGLTLPTVDFLRRRLTVDRQLVLLPGQGPVFGPPKTESSYRSVPLPDVALEALSVHLAEWGTGPDELVFTNQHRDPIRRTRFSDEWRRTRTAAGLPSAVRFHDLRHFYASLLIRHGESVKVVQSRLGHASASETLDTYGHLWPDSDDQTRDAVDSVLGSPASSVRPAASR